MTLIIFINRCFNTKFSEKYIVKNNTRMIYAAMQTSIWVTKKKRSNKSKRTRVFGRRYYINTLTKCLKLCAPTPKKNQLQLKREGDSTVVAYKGCKMAPSSDN